MVSAFLIMFCHQQLIFTLEKVNEFKLQILPPSSTLSFVILKLSLPQTRLKFQFFWKAIFCSCTWIGGRVKCSLWNQAGLLGYSNQGLVSCELGLPCPSFI